MALRAKTRGVQWRLSVLLGGLLSLPINAAPADDSILAPGSPGSPALTQSLVDRNLAVWEYFFEVTFDQAQRAQLRTGMVNIWNKPDRQKIQNTLDNVKYYGHSAELKALRERNQDSVVTTLRADNADPISSLLIAAFDAAHPDRRNRDSGKALHIAGKWVRSDALLAGRRRDTLAPQGVSSSDVLILEIEPSGRFKHVWSHRQCSNSSCCHEYGTTANGTLAVEGSIIALKAESGTTTFKDPCVTPPKNRVGDRPPQEARVRWSLQPDAPGSAAKLCLAPQPFQLNEPGSPSAVCYEKRTQ